MSLFLMCDYAGPIYLTACHLELGGTARIIDLQHPSQALVIKGKSVLKLGRRGTQGSDK